MLNAQRRPGGAGAADHNLAEIDAAQHTRPRLKFKQLIELAAIFAPEGAVPAVIIRPDGLILHHCPPDIAEALPTEGKG